MTEQICCGKTRSKKTTTDSRCDAEEEQTRTNNEQALESLLLLNEEEENRMMENNRVAGSYNFGLACTGGRTVKKSEQISVGKFVLRYSYWSFHLLLCGHHFISQSNTTLVKDKVT